MGISGNSTEAPSFIVLKSHFPKGSTLLVSFKIMNGKYLKKKIGPVVNTCVFLAIL